MKKTEKTPEVLEISEIKMREVDFALVGTSPMIMNRFSQKAWQELLCPSRSRNAASLEQSLKHDPIAEFRGAIYLNRDKTREAAIHLPNGAVHGSLAQAAIDIPGAKRAQIERLTRVTNINIDLFGIPQVFCAMVRNSDINRTPDVRTRPIFPRWACKVTVSFVSSILSQRTIGNLLGAAGTIVGIGDWRGAKGGPYGAFRLTTNDDPEFASILKTEGRVPQLHAIEHPIFYDDDTAELLRWFEAEVARREQDVPSSRVRKRNGGLSNAPKVPVLVENSHGAFEGADNV